MKGIRNALIGIFIAVTDFAGSFVEGILNTLGGIFGFDNIGTVVKDIFIGFRDAIVNVFSNILQFVIDMIYKVPFAEKVLGEKPVIGTSASVTSGPQSGGRSSFGLSSSSSLVSGCILYNTSGGDGQDGSLSFSPPHPVQVALHLQW